MRLGLVLWLAIWQALTAMGADKPDVVQFLKDQKRKLRSVAFTAEVVSRLRDPSAAPLREKQSIVVSSGRSLVLIEDAASDVSRGPLSSAKRIIYRSPTEVVALQFSPGMDKPYALTRDRHSVKSLSRSLGWPLWPLALEMPGRPGVSLSLLAAQTGRPVAIVGPEHCQCLEWTDPLASKTLGVAVSPEFGGVLEACWDSSPTLPEGMSSLGYWVVKERATVLGMSLPAKVELHSGLVPRNDLSRRPQNGFVLTTIAFKDYLLDPPMPSEQEYVRYLSDPDVSINDNVGKIKRTGAIAARLARLNESARIAAAASSVAVTPIGPGAVVPVGRPVLTAGVWWLAALGVAVLIGGVWLRSRDGGSR